VFGDPGNKVAFSPIPLAEHPAERSSMERRSSVSGKICGEAIIILAVAFCTVICSGHDASATGNAARGEVLYQGCQDCHSIEKNDVGPMHRGVVGRTSGTVSGYDYSSALRNAKIVWTEENLDKWLTEPQQLVPGTKMFYDVANPQDRADLIAFLKERAR
jgi:cytochrome c